MNPSDDQAAGLLTFNRTSTSSASTTLPSQVSVAIAQTLPFSAKSDIYFGLNAGAERQVSQFEVGGAVSASSSLIVQITDYQGNLEEYAYRVKAGSTITEIANDLINRLYSDAQTVESGSTIEASVATIQLLAAVPGRTFSLSTAESTGTTTLSTPVTPNTGSDPANTKWRKLASSDIDYGFDSNGRLQVSPTIRWFSGTPTGAQIQSNPLSVVKHPNNMATILDAADAE